MSNKYIHRFFSLNTAPEVLPFFAGCKERAAKEVTESFAMWYAATQVLRLDPSDGDMCLIVVGDGRRPRTAGLCAYLSKWTCVSVDPQLHMEWWEKHRQEQENYGHPIQRLILHPWKIEESIIDCDDRATCLMLPHSHATLLDSLPQLCNYRSLDIISMPCCKSEDMRFFHRSFAQKHLQMYADENVWSPKNFLYIWKSLTESDVKCIIQKEK